MQLLNIEGQELEYYPEKNILKLIINSPFNSASKQYNWKLESKGVGISEKVIKLASSKDMKLLILIQGETFTQDAWVIQNFCEKNKSIYVKKSLYGEIKLYVYPIIYLEKDNELKTITLSNFT